MTTAQIVFLILSVAFIAILVCAESGSGRRR